MQTDRGYVTYVRLIGHCSVTSVYDNNANVVIDNTDNDIDNTGNNDSDRRVVNSKNLEHVRK